MDNRVGMIIGIFVMAIVGLALFLPVAQQVGASTTTLDAANASYTMPNNGVTIDLEGQELISSVVIYNATGTLIPASNYTVAEGISATTGLKTITLTNDDTVFQGQSINLSYTYGPDGYIENGGARSIASLIIIFFALGIAVIVLYPTLKERLGFS